MAKITFRPDVVEALREIAEHLGQSMEETANNAVLAYHQMVCNQDQSDSMYDEQLSSLMAKTAFGREILRYDRQREIEDEERDIAFHKKHNRPYTPIR